MTLTKSDLTAIGTLIDEKLEQKLKPLVTAQKTMQRILNRVKKDLDWVIGTYDSRLKHLEKHSSHPPGRVAD